MRKNTTIFQDSRKGYLSQDYISFLNIFGDWIEFRTFVRILVNSDVKIRLQDEESLFLQQTYYFRSKYSIEDQVL